MAMHRALGKACAICLLPFDGGCQALQHDLCLNHFMLVLLYHEFVVDTMPAMWLQVKAMLCAKYAWIICISGEVLLLATTGVIDIL